MATALCGVFALTASAAIAAPLVYVDNPADFTPANPLNGQIVTWRQGFAEQVVGLTYGTDAFGTIQDGLDGVDPNGTVRVAPGTYVENPEMIKDGVTLRGPGWLTLGRNRVTNPVSNTVEPTLPTDTTEAILIPAVSYVIDGTLLTVGADNLTVEGMMFSGMNAALGPGMHAARGIATGKETNDCDPLRPSGRPGSRRDSGTHPGQLHHRPDVLLVGPCPAVLTQPGGHF
jgi:hypothetical protein